MVLMILTYTPQGPPGNPPESLEYAVNGEVLTVTHRTHRFAEPDPETGERPVEVDVESVDTFDFSGLPDGELDREGIVTSLPVQPIVAGSKVAGELTLTVLDWSV